MRIIIALLATLAVTQASSIKLTIESLQNSTAITQSHPQLQEGMSGFVIHKIDDTRSSIIANASVKNIDSNKATIEVSKYNGTLQESLPTIKIEPTIADEIIIASDYSRALAIAPNEDTYEAITKSLARLNFIHPDIYAAYLSSVGHPTPTREDFSEFCTSNSIGLLYIQSDNNLYTLDCKSLSLLQITPFASASSSAMTPFFSRVENIRSAWWGDGSSLLNSYEPYYKEQIKKYNPNKL